jgi:hypothetical protein
MIRSTFPRYIWTSSCWFCALYVERKAMQDSVHQNKMPGWSGFLCIQFIERNSSDCSQERRDESWTWISFQKSFAPVLMSSPPPTIIPISTPPPHRTRTHRSRSQRDAASLRFSPAHLLNPQSISALHLIIAKTANTPNALLKDLAVRFSSNGGQDNCTRWTNRLRRWSRMAHISVLGWKDR